MPHPNAGGSSARPTTELAEAAGVWEALEPLLPRVQKPARYIGCETGAVVPDWTKAARGAVSWLLVYPDTYEVGQPNQGLQILFEILNERADALAERSYAPWSDLEELMRLEGVPLFSVDTHRAAGDFDLLAFNLSAELTYTNLLNCVDLAGVPVRSTDRSAEHPFVVAGGHCTYNPEPLADFLDFAVIGDGEEVVGEITEAFHDWRSEGGSDRRALLERMASVEGVYVPTAYGTSGFGPAAGVTKPLWPGAPGRVAKRVIPDLADWPYPKHQMAPLTEVVHDRLNVEVFRGCTRGCRFCQAGMVTRPVRERPAAQVADMVREGLARSGYDEVALTSLSTADYSGISDLLGDLMADDAEGRLTLSLPSLRVDAFGVDIAAQVQKGRRTGLTFAPEAGTWRLRRVINKHIDEDDLYAAVDAAFGGGWRRVKLYFLIGLPTETDEDTLGIAHLAERCIEIGRQHLENPSITLSVGGFVPKPFTPFQWFGQDSVAELRRKLDLLRDALRRNRSVQLRWHDPEATFVEGLLSRGDRRLGRVIERVWRAGGTFQEWSECFDIERWQVALEAEGLAAEDYVTRSRSAEEALPWDHLDAGLQKDFLREDLEEALREDGPEDCRWSHCYDCGTCTGLDVDHVVLSSRPPSRSPSLAGGPS